MAFSYNEYTANGSQDTFTTPPYLDEAHLEVFLDGTEQNSSTYTVIGTSLEFNTAPDSGTTVRIGRNSNRSARLTDYSDASLLTADAMDFDAKQMFYIAQEAFDISAETNIGSNTFYNSSSTAPENPKIGDLWYDIGSKYLKIFNGNEWVLAVPTNDTLKYESFINTEANYSYIEVPAVHKEALVFLNGVKLVEASQKGFLLSTYTSKPDDYYIDVENERIYFAPLNNDNIVEVVLTVGAHGGSGGSEGDGLTIVDNGDGSFTFTNTNDGTTIVINDGNDGADAPIPTVTDNGDGTFTIDNGNGDVVTFSDGEDGETPVKGFDYFDGNEGSFVSFIYKKNSSQPATPTGGTFNGNSETFPTGGWYDTPTATASDIEWVSTTKYTHDSATDTWSNNGWSTPSLFFQKGDDGADGSSVIIRGSLATTTGLSNLNTIPDLGDGYIIDGELWVCISQVTPINVDDFQNVGPIVGSDGADAHIHFAYADDNQGTGFTTSYTVGKSWLGIYADNSESSSTTWSHYNWQLIKGADGETITWLGELEAHPDTTIPPPVTTTQLVQYIQLVPGNTYRASIDYTPYESYGSGRLYIQSNLNLSFSSSGGTSTVDFTVTGSGNKQLMLQLLNSYGSVDNISIKEVTAGGLGPELVVNGDFNDGLNNWNAFPQFQISEGKAAYLPDNNLYNGWAYYNSTEGKSYIYKNNAWFVMTQDGNTPMKGTDYFDGVDGSFVSFIYKVKTTTPSTPTGGSYNGTTEVFPAGWTDNPSANPDDTEYVSKTKYYQNSSGDWSNTGWSTPSIFYQKGADGQHGVDGMVWKGASALPPSNPQLNWAYKDSSDGIVYIYNGSAWTVMVYDGDEGPAGADGGDGLSVFITYTDKAALVTKPTDSSDGNVTAIASGIFPHETIWNTTPTNNTHYMSQKVAASATEGTWSEPIRVRGARGDTGAAGPAGSGRFFGDYVSSLNYWTDAQAEFVITTDAQRAPTLGDVVSLSDQYDRSDETTKMYNGSGVWSTVALHLNGSLLVDGSVSADALAVGAISADIITTGTLNADRIEANSLDVGGKAVSGSIGNIEGTAGIQVNMDNAPGYHTLNAIFQFNQYQDDAPRHIKSDGTVLGGSPLFSYSFTTGNFNHTRPFIVQVSLDVVGWWTAGGGSGFSYAMVETSSATDYQETDPNHYVSTKGTSRAGAGAMDIYNLNDIVNLSGNKTYYIWVFGVMEKIDQNPQGTRGIESGTIQVIGLNK